MQKANNKPAAFSTILSNSVVVMAFSSLARMLGECSTIHSMSALLKKVEISWRTPIPLFTPGSVHSGSAS